MRYERSDHERLTDNAILMCLWARSQNCAGSAFLGDRIKLMKLAFFTAYDLYVQQIKALNLEFYRWDLGPMAREVYSSWDNLRARGLMAEDELWFVTEEGIRFASSFANEVLSLTPNEPILRAIDDVVGRYAAMSTEEIKDAVYKMYCYTLDSPLRKHEVKSIARGKVFTRSYDEDEVETSLFIPPGWQITLELAFHSQAVSDFRRGVEDAHEGRIYGWEALGAEV